jgi:hypothetical protein
MRAVNRSRATAVLFAVLALILTAVFYEMNGPAPKPASVPPFEFSAERALAVEREILGGEVPHPVGSAAHDAVRDRLVEKLRSFGYDVTLQKTFACNANASCAPLANVIARPPADNRGDAVLLAAHYDSVPAGPGVTDDGSGMAAVVEAARALRGVATRNPIVFLITDGEESGLLGAEGFAADPALIKPAAAVINVDARGTTGRDYLFETSQRNEWLIRVVSRALPHPVSSSLFFNIYELLPNDTDVTVFRRAGLAALNFANTGRVQQYHTPLDNFEHADLRTLQDRGDHVVAMARALGNADVRQTSDGNAVWFDVLSQFLLWWPQRWSMALSIAALLIAIVAGSILVVDGKTTASEITVGVTSFFISIIGAFVIGIGGSWLASLRAAGAVWVAQPGPAIAAMWLIGVAVACTTAARLFAASSVDGLFLGHAMSWSTLAIALSIFLPGGSYLAVVPAIVAAILMMLRASAGIDDAVVAIGASIAAAIVVFPLAVLVYGALGRPSLPLIAAVVALVTTNFAPLLAPQPLGRALGSALVVAAIVCVVMASLVPNYTRDLPRAISLRYFDDGEEPRWLADGLSKPLIDAGHFEPIARSFSPWLARPGRVYAARAPRIALPAPALNVVSDSHQNGRHLRLRVASNRGAQRIALIFRGSLASLRVNGVAPPAHTARYSNPFAPGWQQVTVRGATETMIDLDLKRDETIDAVVLDVSYGLPPEGSAIAAARNLSTAVPLQEGDTTMVLRRTRI